MDHTTLLSIAALNSSLLLIIVGITLYTRAVREMQNQKQAQREANYNSRILRSDRPPLGTRVMYAKEPDEFLKDHLGLLIGDVGEVVAHSGLTWEDNGVLIKWFPREPSIHAQEDNRVRHTLDELFFPGNRHTPAYPTGSASSAQ